MLRKILMLGMCAVLLNLIPFDKPRADTLHNYYFRIQGGVMGTSAQLEQGSVWGMAKAGFLRPVYKDQIAIGGNLESIKNAGSDWVNYCGKVFFYSKSIEKVKVSKPGSGRGLIEESKTQIYGFTGLGGTHESGGSFAEASFSGGIGVMFPFMETTSIIEFEASQMKKDWYFGLNAGLQIGFDF